MSKKHSLAHQYCSTVATLCCLAWTVPRELLKSSARSSSPKSTDCGPLPNAIQYIDCWCFSACLLIRALCGSCTKGRAGGSWGRGRGKEKDIGICRFCTYNLLTFVHSTLYNAIIISSSCFWMSHDLLSFAENACCSVLLSAARP